jgi:hypothetical protein
MSGPAGISKEAAAITSQVATENPTHALRHRCDDPHSVIHEKKKPSQSSDGVSGAFR